jgi:DNA-directed RNA polymerase subunit RPC12/RpoP
VWLVKTTAALIALLWLQSEPSIFIIVTWAAYAAAVVWWVRGRTKTEPEVKYLTKYEEDDTQELPLIRHIRCPHCKHEQLGPVDHIITCADNECGRQFRVPKPGRQLTVDCPECGFTQPAEEGQYHFCVNKDCGYGAFVEKLEQPQ